MHFQSYEITMSDAGAIELPDEVAVALGPNVVLFKGEGGTLILCPEDRFDSCLGAIMAPADRSLRDRKRFAVSGAYSAELGSHGKLEIPEHLAWSAGLSRDLTLQCLGTHCKIINRAR